MLFSLAMVLTASAPKLQAVNYYWNNPDGGLFSTSGNWNPAGPANWAGHVALIDLPGAYPINLNADLTLGQMFFSNNCVVNLDLGAKKITTTVSAIGDNNASLFLREADVTIVNGTFVVSYGNGGYLNLSHKGRLTFSGPDTVANIRQTTTANTASTNYFLSVTNGAKYYSSWNTISGVGGLIHVSGADTLFYATNYVYMYSNFENTNLFVIDNGAALKTPTIYLGNNAGPGTPHMIVTDPGSVITGATLYVGTHGNGFLTVSNQAQAIFTTTYIRPVNATGSVLTVTGPGSFFDTRNLYVAGDSVIRPPAELRIDDGALVQVTNVLQVWPEGTLRLDNGALALGAVKTLDLRGKLQGRGNIDTITGVLFTVQNTGTLLLGSPIGEMVMNHANYNQTATALMEFEIGGAAPGQYGRLMVGGDMALAGFVRITFTNGYEPAVGDLFDLMDWDGTLTGMMAPFLPDIWPKRWVTRDFYHSGELWIAGPELAVRTLAPSNVVARSALLRGRILSVGDAEDPNIFFCIGKSDGGTNSPSNWERVVSAGSSWTQDEDFELYVDGLQPETTYYYRCYATNSTGIAWSTAPLLSFSTSFRPSIVNLGATVVNRWIWNLEGEVTDTGGEMPDIWFHYWTGNGPTSVVYAGSVDGPFSAQLSSLKEDALYYFYARATNAAGAVLSTTNSFSTAPASENAIYVNPDATAPNTGASWQDAYTSLQAAIDSAMPDTAIYVSGGTVAHNAEVRIGVKNDIRIKGGYEGISGTPGYHDPATYPTRVIPTAATPAHRVFSIYNSTNIFIEDIEIAHGRFVHNNTVAAQYTGSGVLVSNSAGILLAGCNIISNRPATTGNNQRLRGAGVCAVRSELTISNCNLSWNYLTRESGTISWLRGGAIAVTGSVLNVVDSKIDANILLYSTASRGDGIYTENTTAKIRNCAVVGNTPSSWDSAIPLGIGLFVASGTATVESCTFLNNMGAGIHVADTNASVSVSNSIIWANSSDLSGPAVIAAGYCNIGNMPTNYDVGPGCFTANPMFERGLFLATNSPCVDAGSGNASAFALADQTTRADGLPDAGRLDLGWHRRQGYNFNGLPTLYVRTDGNDNNPGTMPALPLRTITKALSLAREGTHIHVAQGTYEQDSGETFPLWITRWGIKIIGEDRENTILHARASTNLVHVLQSHGDSGLANLSLIGGWVFYNRFPEAGLIKNILKLYGINEAQCAAGPGIWVQNSGGFTLENVNIISNRAQAHVANCSTAGGGLLAIASHVTLNNCVVHSNRMSMTGVHNWMTGVGAGIFAHNSQIILSNSIVSSNSIYGHYGPTKYSNGGVAMFLGNPSGPCLITDSRISHNLYRFGGSGASASYCVYGGALSIIESPYPLTINRTLVVNNFITNANSMTVGKAIYARNAPLVINSSTIADNHSDYPSAAIALNSHETSSLVFSNSISWGNGMAFSGLMPDAFGVYSSLWYSCFEDAKNINTQGCFSIGPKFIGQGDYHLQSAMGRWEDGVWVVDTTMSPCIDAGSPEADASEEPMPNGGRINIGAYGGTFQASKTYFGPTMHLPITGLTNRILHGYNPPAQTFYVGVTSEWSRDLAYKTTTNASWLSLSPSTGIVEYAVSPQAIQANYITEDLPIGEHIAQVSVSSYDAASGFPATNANQSLAVKMFVEPPPALTLWPASISVESEEDRNAATQTFWVSNSSPYFASILTNSSPVSWAGVSPATTRLAPGGVMQMNVSFSNSWLTAGSYDTALAVHGAVEEFGAPLANFLLIPLHLTMKHTSPRLSVSPASFNLVIQEGQNPLSQAIMVHNSASHYPMAFSVLPNASWLSVNPPTGSSTGEVRRLSLDFDTDSLPAGTYEAALSITALDASNGQPAQNSPWKIAVNLKVRPPSGDETNLVFNATKGIYSNRVEISWEPGESIAWYELWRNDTADLKFASKLADITGLSYNDTSVQPGIKYFYWLRPVTESGFTGSFTQPSIGWRALAPPTSVSATKALYPKRIRIDWNASEGAETYEVWRSTSPSDDAVSQVFHALGLYYEDNNIQPGVTYYYRIRSRRADVSSALSDATTGYSLGVPGRLQAGKGDFNERVLVHWEKAAGALSYELWRAHNDQFSSAIRLAETMSLSVEDTTALPGSVYTYWARAINPSARSDFSAPDRGYRSTAQADIKTTSLVWLPRALAPGQQPDIVSWTLANNGPGVMAGNNTHLAVTLWAVNRLNNTVTELADWKTSVALAPGESAVMSATEAQRSSIRALSPGDYDIYIKLQHSLPSTLGDGRSADNTARRDGGSILVREGPRTTLHVRNDYNADGRSDLAVVNRVTGEWFIRGVAGELIVWCLPWGGPGLKPVVGDFDGDKAADIASYFEPSGGWFIYSPLGRKVHLWNRLWGGVQYEPVWGDFTGAGHASMAVYSRATGQWFIEDAVWGLLWGGEEFDSVSGDFDGDSRFDLAVYDRMRGLWFVRNIEGALLLWSEQFGGLGFEAVAGDFDGDGKWDMAVYNSYTGAWYIRTTAGSALAWGVVWGGYGMTPVSGDFDGDGNWDMAVYHEATGAWYIWSLTRGPLAWGAVWGGPGFEAP